MFHYLIGRYLKDRDAAIATRLSKRMRPAQETEQRPGLGRPGILVLWARSEQSAAPEDDSRHHESRDQQWHNGNPHLWTIKEICLIISLNQLLK